jgi:hypothetical protein
MAGSDQNLLAELPELKQETLYGEYYFFGGHRLWHAPEAFPRTYIPDNEGLEYEVTSGGVNLKGIPEQATGIQKFIHIELFSDRPGLKLHHRLQNNGLWPVELAPWTITQLPLGDMGVFPQTVGPLDQSGLLPNRSIVLWPYTGWDDSRMQLKNDYILVHAEPRLPPVKIGYLNRCGWAGYLRDDIFFCKRFVPRLDQQHVDFGCNCESYCNNQFFELETLGPVSRLEPGQEAVHIEEWEIYPVLNIPRTLEGVQELVEKLSLA